MRGKREGEGEGGEGKGGRRVRERGERNGLGKISDNREEDGTSAS